MEFCRYVLVHNVARFSEFGGTVGGILHVGVSEFVIIWFFNRSDLISG